LKDLNRYIFAFVLFASFVFNAHANGSEDNAINEILGIDADLEYGEYLASECAACHNPNAGSDSAVPVIHGIEALIIIDKLIAYREGTLENISMQSVAKVMSNEEIAALAAYLSAR